MAKKKNHKPRPKYRNAAPRASHKPEEEPINTERLTYTALGAAGTALVGGFLAKQDWSPTMIATALTAVGGAMAAGGKTDKLQAIGTGAFGAGGGQLALLLMDDHRNAQKQGQDKKGSDKRQANLNLPAGALEAAFERARSHMSMTTDDYDHYEIS